MLELMKIEGAKGAKLSAPYALMTSTLVICFLTSFVCAEQKKSSAPGQASAEQLFSPSVGQKFYEIAHELAGSNNIDSNQAEQAIIFLQATSGLDTKTSYVMPDLVKLIRQPSGRDYTQLAVLLIKGYLNETTDLEVAKEAIRYMLEGTNFREQRQRLLSEILNDVGNKNNALASDMAAELGFLMVETADPNAVMQFQKSYSSNKYNKLAFEKLSELIPEQISPAIYLEHLRLVLAENPLNLEAALNFAQYAGQLQLYQTACEAYEYCADLFGYLYPSKALPAAIYLPWMMSNYNTELNQNKCINIVENIRKSGRFDLIAEAIAGKAAAKMGHTEQASQLLTTAADIARADYKSSRTEKSQLAAQLAWFYSFALPDADESIDWANKAYSADPNSPTTAAILAYSFVENGQPNSAKPIIEKYERTQISDLAMAQVQLAEEKKDEAVVTIKAAIAKDPGSLEAEKAKEILTQNGAEYVPPTAPDVIQQALENTFGPAVITPFVRPQKLISYQFNLRGSNFAYGSELTGSLVITNTSAGKLIISDDAMFTGNIRIDADITGDLNMELSNLISERIRPSLPVDPGANVVVPLKLDTGELRRILLTYPQASLDIELTAFLDPVDEGSGKVVNRLMDIPPAKVTVRRPPIEITTKFLQNRLDSISKGTQGPKIKTLQLFVGLLAEQNAMANREPLYKFVYADWMPTLLKSAVLQGLADKDWVVKVHTMAAVLSLPMDYQLINAVSENLNDTHWPVRLMSLYLLSKVQNGNFKKVLDWAAKYDSFSLVKDMAVALGAVRPQPQKQQRAPAGEMPEKSEKITAPDANKVAPADVIPKESEKITAPDANDVTPAGVITKEFEKIIAPKDNQPAPVDVNTPY
jgi:hypothetical protein